MKRIASAILSVVLIFGLCTTASATKAKTIDELLAPYQAVIDKLNAELGLTMYIPDKNKEKVYNNIKDMSTDEFEAMLRDEYKTTDPSYRIQSDSSNYTKDSAVDASPNTQRKNNNNDDYTRDSAKGKKSGPSLIPNFSGSIPFTPLK